RLPFRFGGPLVGEALPGLLGLCGGLVLLTSCRHLIASFAPVPAPRIELPRPSTDRRRVRAASSPSGPNTCGGAAGVISAGVTFSTCRRPSRIPLHPPPRAPPASPN